MLGIVTKFFRDTQIIKKRNKFIYDDAIDLQISHQKPLSSSMTTIRLQRSKIPDLIKLLQNI